MKRILKILTAAICFVVGACLASAYGLGPGLWDDPTHVSGTIVPRSSNFDLGSVTEKFRNLYLSGSVTAGSTSTLTVGALTTTGPAVSTIGSNLTVNGVVTDASIVATANQVTQGAALSGQVLYAVPTGKSGLYNVSYYSTVTRAASTSSTLGGATGLKVTCTSPYDSVSKTSNPTTPVISAGNTTATMIDGMMPVFCKAGANISYDFGYTSSGGTSMQYDIHLAAKLVSLN